MLNTHDTAPDFTLQDKDGRAHALSDISSAYTVLYFYPKDNTPGCTTEAQEFSRLKKEFEKKGATIIGISGGDTKTKTKFCTNNDLTITLLSDPDHSVATAYGVYGEKQFMGKTFMGIRRTTFILDANKHLIKTFENVRAAGHAQEVLDTLSALE